jgi:hypothetical protein
MHVFSSYGHKDLCKLLYEEHVTKKYLFVKLTRDMTNAEAGKELFKIKVLLTEQGFEGIAFLNLNKEFKIS